mgnify:CR=1 FL=1
MLNFQGTVYIRNRITYSLSIYGGSIFLVNPGSVLSINQHQMEGESVEDREIQFNVFVYNNQPGISIDYATGDSHLADFGVSETNPANMKVTYIINKNTHIFHLQNCSSVQNMKPKNRKETTELRDELLLEGNRPCRRCNP